MSRDRERYESAPWPDQGVSALSQGVVEIPHDPNARPVTAIRNVLLQSSLSELKEHGFYERYQMLMNPQQLGELLARLGPGWIPIELALAHYEACDNLMLSAAELEQLGGRVGARLQQTLLVSAAKSTRSTNGELRSATGPLYRMWSRIYQGGSTQLVRVGPRESLLEARGYLLHRFQYYRQGQLAAMRVIFEAIFTKVSVKLVSYSEARDEAVFRVALT